MTLVSSLVIGMLESERVRYQALRNSIQWDEARYLAEAGVHDALMNLEQDYSWRLGVPPTEFPPGSGKIYSATVSKTDDGLVLVQATGNAGNSTRYLSVTVKQGG
ncbi:hypothetical protein LOC67_13490 [Stieleria sp. JC731]|uniref:hypothetical protein n=1 Tax=Pirellulaceae TaxID=2691357 RepID=UPI001E3CF940|nr:hypothetical protein [Stieleria sp. JC731]MCC9601565.1 hypothetical protein [Stieleria sp. JC731]